MAWQAQTPRAQIVWLLTRGFATIPDDDYGAKDLDGGGVQTLFGSDKGNKRR